MKKIAIVLAGGRGSRMNSEIPKQYLLLKDKPVLYYSLKMFQESEIDKIILVAGSDDVEMCLEKIVTKYHLDKVVSIVEGGAERYDSVYHGLNAVKTIYNDCNHGKDVYVFIHDGARPCVNQEVIHNCFLEAEKFGAATAAVPVKDTIKVVDREGFAVDTPDRSTLWQVQTPQVFRYELIVQAYKEMFSDPERGVITDDAMLVERYTDVKVKMAMGSYNNIKITTPEDMAAAARILETMM